MHWFYNVIEEIEFKLRLFLFEDFNLAIFFLSAKSSSLDDFCQECFLARTDNSKTEIAAAVFLVCNLLHQFPKTISIQFRSNGLDTTKGQIMLNTFFWWLINFNDIGDYGKEP